MIDLFQLGRVLHERFPSPVDYDAPAVDLAMRSWRTSKSI